SRKLSCGIKINISIIRNTLFRVFYIFIFYYYIHQKNIHSFPTRRSSDLIEEIVKVAQHAQVMRMTAPRGDIRGNITSRCSHTHQDRKSTRLNSSHSQISYAVFCLKKKKTEKKKYHNTKTYDPNITLHL